MFERLKSVFGRRTKNSVADATVADAAVPVASTPEQILAAEEEIVRELASAASLPSESIEAQTDETLERIASLLANEPPKLKRGSPGGQEYVVKLTYNQKEWIEHTYPNYVKSNSLAPFQRVLQAFVEKYIQSVDSVVNSVATEIETGFQESTGQEA